MRQQSLAQLLGDFAGDDARFAIIFWRRRSETFVQRMQDVNNKEARLGPEGHIGSSLGRGGVEYNRNRG